MVESSWNWGRIWRQGSGDNQMYVGGDEQMILLWVKGSISVNLSKQGRQPLGNGYLGSWREMGGLLDQYLGPWSDLIDWIGYSDQVCGAVKFVHTYKWAFWPVGCYIRVNWEMAATTFYKAANDPQRCRKGYKTGTFLSKHDFKTIIFGTNPMADTVWSTPWWFVHNSTFIKWTCKVREVPPNFVGCIWALPPFTF